MVYSQNGPVAASEAWSTGLPGGAGSSLPDQGRGEAQGPMESHLQSGMEFQASLNAFYLFFAIHLLCSALFELPTWFNLWNHG